ncbi:MAG TPA: ATP-binding protein [Candidatus Caenarcaniphilales bacterium]|nr:ATP-binding protein [Candidatus Caenarcaniphilales bacterium]
MPNSDASPTRAHHRRRRRIETTSRHRIEGARELSRTLLTSVQDGIMVSRARDGAIVDANPRLTELTGYARDELVGCVPPYPFWPPEQAEAIGHTLEQAFVGQVGEYDFEFQARDGSRIAVIAARAPLRDGGGRVVGAVTTIKDVTERRAAEEALRHSQQQLQQAQRMEAVGRLAGGIAHDFNNLLTAITGYTDLILSDLRDEGVRPDLEEIRRTADRAAALTRQLLVFSRREVLQPTVVDLNRIVANLEPMLQRLLGEEIQLVTLLHPRLRPVRADPGQLEQVIVNLAVNARDAMPDGGLLTIETLDQTTEPADGEAEGDGQPARYAVLTVTDTGHGMDEETQAHLFEPFYTTKEQGKGTGLGLATVYGIVTHSGGTIDVQSGHGHGTTFRIVLPEADSEEILPTPTPVTGPPLTGDETVLVAEDDPTVRALVSQVLRRLGYRVLEAAAPSQAQLVAERYGGPIHMLLSDVIMPGMRGPELARRLAEVRPEMRVLFMSGYTDDAVLADGILEGEGEFLEKPFTATTLGRRVRSVLDGPVPASRRLR